MPRTKHYEQLEPQRPLLQFLLDEASASGKTDREIAARAGFSPGLITNLRKGLKYDFLTINFEAFAGALGYDVVLVKRDARPAGRDARSTSGTPPRP